VKIIQQTIQSDSAEAPLRLDRFVQTLTGLSRAGVRGLLDNGCVTVNDSNASKPNAQLAAGDRVRIAYNPHQKYKEKPTVEDDPAYKILYEDEDLIVVDKAAHVLTVPTSASHGTGKSLIEALQKHVSRGKPEKLWKKLYVVHRLDQGVSGVMVVAKTAQASSKIKDQFASHKPQRIYIAIVNGALERKKGTFRSYLATDYSLNRYSTKRKDHGELAITHWEVVGGSNATSSRPNAVEFSVVQVQLETGRRNQIRVHFAEAGHPVLGDPRYPRKLSDSEESEQLSSMHPRWRSKRIALHAHSLEFTHPRTGKSMRFESSLPQEYSWFMRQH
jgi:23S rRNA pseudouridine1911/1915/1917 synthase